MKLNKYLYGLPGAFALKTSASFFLVLSLLVIFALPSPAFAADTDLKAAILNVAGTIIQIVPPFCQLIGIFMIFGGLKRLADGNSSPHGGKGGGAKIFAGACLLQIGVIYGVLEATLKPILDLVGYDSSKISTGTTDSGVTDAVNTTGGYIVGAIMGVAFITGIIYIGKGIFMLSSSESGGKNSAYDAWRHIVIGAIFLSFGVALGVARTTISSSGGTTA